MYKRIFFSKIYIIDYVRHKLYNGIWSPHDSCNYYKCKQTCLGLDYAIHITWTWN